MKNLVKLTIQQAFERQVEETPERVALLFEDRHLTYRELNKRANRLAWFLRERGLKKNRLVAVMFDKGIQMIVAMLGILKAGGAFVPLDPDYPIYRLQAIISDISPFFYITEKKFLDMALNILPAELKTQLYVPDLAEDEGRVYGSIYTNGGLNLLPVDNPDCTVTPLDIAHIYYTTGSTGEPKGIAGPHRLILHMARWFNRVFGGTDSDRFSQLAVFSYDACLRCIFIPFTCGGTVCIITEKTRHNPAALIDWIERMKVTIVQTVPGIFGAMLKQLTSMKRARDYFKALRYITFVGEVLPARFVRRWMDIYHKQPALVNTFGTTETLSKSAFFINRYPVNPDKSIPIGKGIDNTELLILKNGKLCKPSQEGELYIRSPIMTLGYFKKEKKTAEVFLQNPLHDNYPDIVYKTGDLARYLPGGDVEFLGRIDSQVKIRGIRVELGEIEGKLLSHKNINQAVVIYKDINDNEKELIAYIVLENAVGKINLKEIRAYLGQSLPNYMIPSFFIILDKLPINNSGKINRKALPFLKELVLKAGNEYVPPGNRLEEKLVEIWQDLLGTEKIGVEDNFFDLGGHSLKAVQLFSRIYKEFGTQMNLRSIFDNPTIREVATLIEALAFVKGTSTGHETGYEEIEL